jgi:hypothetical protein
MRWTARYPQTTVTWRDGVWVHQPPADSIAERLTELCQSCQDVWIPGFGPVPADSPIAAVKLVSDLLGEPDSWAGDVPLLPQVLPGARPGAGEAAPPAWPDLTASVEQPRGLFSALGILLRH